MHLSIVLIKVVVCFGICAKLGCSESSGDSDKSDSKTADTDSTAGAGDDTAAEDTLSHPCFGGSDDSAIGMDDS
ncbi:MAG: hypothetical protein JXR76_17215 [Deltaproteobacteria bacterium]|nr:hypothetical protein [Deltaproteobacteria bacterium]